MYKTDLLDSISTYLKNNPSSQFHKDCIGAINKYDYDMNDMMFVLPRDKYLVESVMITLCSNISKYYVCIHNKKIKHCTNFTCKINERIKKLLACVFGLHDDEYVKMNEMFVINIVISNSTLEKKYNSVSAETLFTKNEWLWKLCNPDDIIDNLPLYLAISKITLYAFSDRICVPNMTLKNNTLTIFTRENTNNLYKRTQQDIKTFYDIDIPFRDILKCVPRCSVHGFDIYKGIPVNDVDISIVKKFHLSVKKKIYASHCRGTELLFDMGCGRLTDLFFWNDVGIKNVFCVEPSGESRIQGDDRLSKHKSHLTVNVNVLDGTGDCDWSLDDKYADIISRKYDVITFQFTIHYMLDNIETLMKNILLISKRNTKIIITCMDGNIIRNELRTHDPIEVRNSRNEIIFAIGNMDASNDEILVYMKSGYGMEHGSIEKMVDLDGLTNIFTENGFTMLERKPFLSYNTKLKNTMKTIHRNISKYYTSIIFTKNEI